MKIGLVSDVHASPEPLAEAIQIFRQHAVDQIICAGDIAGYNEDLSATIDLLIDNDVDCIIGNHDQSWLQQHPERADTRDFRFLEALPETLSLELAGKTLYIVHAQPPSAQHGGIKLLDIENQLIPEQIEHWNHTLEDVRADILIVGHTHQVYVEQLDQLLVINPGSSVYNHCCMILELPACTVTQHGLQGEDIKPVWNWGMLVDRAR